MDDHARKVSDGKMGSVRRLAPRNEISGCAPSFKPLDNSLPASIAISTAQHLRDVNDTSHTVVVRSRNRCVQPRRPRTRWPEKVDVTQRVRG
jgi:hypothetical protein